MMYEKLVSWLREEHKPHLISDFDKAQIESAAKAIEELHQRYIEERNAAVELTGELAKMPSWIPVTDRLPNENVPVLITDKIATGTGFLIDGYGWESPFSDIDMSHVTHWMPLPEPPESEGE